MWELKLQGKEEFVQRAQGEDCELEVIIVERGENNQMKDGHLKGEFGSELEILKENGEN